MPITITLRTMPARLEKGRGFTTRILEVFGASLDTVTLTVESKIAAITAAVADFGKRVHGAHPDASFAIVVNLQRGQRKPNGFDAAYNRNGFGQDNWMHVVTRAGDGWARVEA